MRAAYMGSNGTHLNGTGDQEAGLLQVNPAIYIPGQSTEANTQQRRVYPTFGTVDFLDSEVNSNYNGLQLTLEKRFSRGFSFLANYTWAKALDDFGPGGSAGHQSPNGSNTCSLRPHFDYGPDTGDIGKVFKFSGNYLMPRIAINNFAGRLINGWGLSDIATWQTGFPYTFFSDTDNSFTCHRRRPHRPDDTQNQGCHTKQRRSHPQLVNQWFTTSAFTTNAIGTFGDSGKNVLRGPRYFDTDLAVIKNTDLEKGSLVAVPGGIL